MSEVTIASLNDDLLRLRSQLVDGTGLAHLRNPKKGYGTVHNGIVSVGTTESQIRLPGIIHALDRGYQSQSVNQRIVETGGGSIVGTHKRIGRFSFTYDQTASRFQRSVMKKGERKLSFGYKKRIHFETGKEWMELRLSKPGAHKMVR